MKIITGDETGLLKWTAVSSKKVELPTGQEQTRDRGVQAICLANVDAQGGSMIAASHRDGVIRLWDPVSKMQADDLKGAKESIGLEFIESSRMLVTSGKDGSVHFTNCSSPDRSVSTLAVGADIETFHLGPEQSKSLAVGGKEHDLQLWDVEQQKATFKAKNVRHDKLDLRVPVWIKDLAFTEGGASSGFNIVTGTAHRQLRMYDIRAQRRPVLDVEYGEYPVTKICVRPGRQELYVADTVGSLTSLDLRMLKSTGRFVGPAGAIRCLSCHPTENAIAAVGLDRFAHVYNLDSRERIADIYLKQRLNAVLFVDDGSEDQKQTSGSDESEDEAADYEGLEIGDEEDNVDGDDDALSDNEENESENLISERNSKRQKTSS